MLARARIPVLVFTTLTAVYLYAFPSATIPYLVVVLAHILAGLGLALIVAPLVFRSRSMPSLSRAGWIAIAAGAAIGIALLFTGGARRFTPVIYAHLIVSAAGVILILSNRKPMRLVLVFAGALALTGSAWTLRGTWQTAHKIQNPQMPPESQDYEGDGVKGPFFPSSAQTSTGGKIPSKFFMDSQACQRCHPDIYEQWSSSAHRFSSFNDQWYRKSIEYMQDVAGVQSSKWCAGCHDPAL